jgi:lipoate---protein ligase
MEEYFLKENDNYNELIILWRNANSIIVGRNQNTIAEVNYDFAKENHISVSRRLSGGGTVYQDLGNICFTVIKNKESSNSFEYFLKPIVEFLKTLNIESWVHGKNDLYIQGNKKVSGNAQYMYNDKIMHHGTLLYNVDFLKMKTSLKPNKIKLETKSVKSNVASVDNIINHLIEKMDNDSFFRKLSNFFIEKNNYDLQHINDYDTKRIEEIAENKYKKKEWIYSNSQSYTLNKEKRFDWGTIKVGYEAENNKIKEIKFTGDFLSSNDQIEELEKSLIGIDINKEKIVNVALKYDLKDIFGKKFILDDLLELINI